MKRILGIVLALCLVLTLCTDAFAATKKQPQFTKQPKTSTTTKKGSVYFQVNYSGKAKLTWYFIDPEEPDKEYTGKTIKNKFKKLRVYQPNGKKISLSNVPEEMHGWTVYCHLNGNGYKVDSERVQLLVYGMEPPADGPIEGPEGDADSNESSSSSNKTDTEDSGDTEPEEKSSFIISCNEKALRKAGDENADPVSRIQFTEITSFEVKTEETFTSWTANGIRFEVEEPVNGFKITNLGTDLSLNLKIDHPTEEDTQRDESHMCTVKCVGCTFTSLQDNLRGATEGKVPAGTVIIVTADTAELRDAGYKINGDAPINMGLVSFRYTVNDDVEISTK